MTEDTLEKAIGIKKHIDALRDRKRSLEYHQSLCWGNTGEIRSRAFQATITNNGRINSIDVRPETLKLALDTEIKYATEMLDNYITELHELN